MSKGKALFARIDEIARSLAELRIEVARELGMDDDDEILELAAKDLRRMRKRDDDRELRERVEVRAAAMRARRKLR